MERIDILWTGGFDSSYRLCQLSLLPVEIQAYYIDAGKKSYSQEMKAMTDIVAHIQANPSKKCKLLPLVIVKLEDIAPDEQIEDSYNRIRSETILGSQYEWFARFAKQSGLILEIGFETDSNSVFDEYYTSHLTCRQISRPLSEEEGILEYCEPDKERSTEDMMTLFGSFRFGLPLYEMTKLQTKESYKAIGYETVMSMTWFCAHPLMGKPCGMCNPCSTVMKAGMGFRLPFLARILYYLFKANRIGRYVDGKLKVIYNRNWR